MRKLLQAMAVVITLGPLACGPGASPATPPPPPFKMTKVDIGGGRTLELGCLGSGTPTVILEHGSDADASSFGLIMPRIAAVTRACAHNRIGAGGSSEPTGKRTAADMVDDLHALLDAADVARPLILVGHSMGGMTIPLYADRYPDEVAGMLFIDPAAPGMLAALGAALGEPMPGEPADVTERRRIFAVGWPGPQYNTERHDVATSEKQTRAVKSLGDIPVIVLSAEELIWTVSDPAAQAKLVQAWQAMHAKVAKLSTEGRHEIVEGSGHGIQATNPDTVINSIIELVERARE